MEYQQKELKGLIKEEGKFKYIEEGEGEVLLLLHGLFGALSNYRDVLSYFSSKNRVVIPILPIYELPLRSVSVKGLAKFVHEFVEFKGYRDLLLLGNSLGGHVAIVYALEHQERVKAIVLTGSSGLYENTMGATYPRKSDYNFIKEKTEYTFYDPATANKELVDEVYASVNNRSKALHIIAMSRSAMKHNIGDQLSEINIPVSLIWGNNDVITPPEVAEEFHRLFKNSELNFIDKCGHAAMMERPEEFNEVVDQFLTNLNKD